MGGAKVLLVGWDAADWKVAAPLAESNEMPVLKRVLEQGVMADISTLEPVLSPMLWTSIATGKCADLHGILGFTELDPLTRKVRPVASTSRTCKALWSILHQQGYRSNVAAWFASHPAEPVRGSIVSDAFGRADHILPGSVYPPPLAPELAHLLVRPEEIDAEILRLFIPRLDEIDRSRPNGIATLAKILAECFTTHAVITWQMENIPWDFTAAYYIGIDHFSHAFINFHPPKPDWVAQEDFDLYSGVMAGAYRLMDLFLARLLELAGPDTTLLLLSDHGFHSDHLRPQFISSVPAGPAAQHRPLGMFAMMGPGIRPDERIYGVNLLDIAPTVLSLFGLPAGQDMPGRVLAEAFENPVVPARIPSWEAVPGDAGMHRPETAPAESGDSSKDDAASTALLNQFIALGYVDPLPAEASAAAINCERERDWNLARVFTSRNRFAEALPLLENVHHLAPARVDYLLALADCQLRLGLREEAAATAAVAAKRNLSPPVHYLLSRIAQEAGNPLDSLRHARLALAAPNPSPELLTRVGFVLFRLRREDDALAAFRQAIQLDPHRALAHFGLARVFLRRGLYPRAATAALDSVACRHDMPAAHFVLGVALLRLGDRDRAIQAFETSLSFQPPLRAAHRVLGRILGATPEGARHRALARESAGTPRQHSLGLEALREAALERARRRGTPLVSTAESFDFVLVSGLPRSGTSLMMQMLEAAGVPVMTDKIRTADDDNPEGYLEWEAIRQVGANPAILHEAAGKAIKVISMLLPELPDWHRYKVLFMDRPAAEIAISQRRMLERRGLRPAPVADMERLLREHRAQILTGLRNSAGFEVLVVDYPGLVSSPETWIPKIVDFLGGVPHEAAMRNVVRPELHRNRT